jgi:ADP-ribose pyrophosphatase YjhB (NUDIX family)
MSTKRQVGTAIFVMDATRTKVWLHRRETARDYNGCYALAGGGVDAGEKARKAAARELTEETGLVKPASSFAFLKRTHEEKSPTDKWSTVWYVIILAPEERPKKTESLAGDWDFFEIAALANHPTPLYPGIVEMVPVLEKYLRSLPPTNIAAHYPCALATVDIAVTRSHNDTQEILLGRKKNATKWRFPGGFVDPQQDPDFIHAAYRELSEEVLGCIVSQDFEVLYPGLRVDEPRYASDKDRIYTTLFLLQFSGTPEWETKGGDDLPEVKWFAVSDVDAPATLVREHIPLLNAVRKRLLKSA